MRCPDPSARPAPRPTARRNSARVALLALALGAAPALARAAQSASSPSARELERRIEDLGASAVLDGAAVDRSRLAAEALALKRVLAEVSRVADPAARDRVGAHAAWLLGRTLAALGET